MNTHPFEIEFVRDFELSKLNPAGYNPREMTDEARSRLEYGLKTFGIVDPFIARAEDKLLVGGHQRLLSASNLKMRYGPVILVYGLSDQQAAALNVLLNNPNAQGTWDMGKLTELLSELDSSGFDTTLTGFDEKELEKLLAEAGGEPAVNLEPEDERYSEQYGVIVVCESAEQQERVYSELQQKGYNCKVVVT